MDMSKQWQNARKDIKPGDKIAFLAFSAFLALDTLRSALDVLGVDRHLTPGFLTLTLHALPSLLPISLHVAQARPLFHSSRRLAQPRRGKSS